MPTPRPAPELQALLDQLVATAGTIDQHNKFGFGMLMGKIAALIGPWATRRVSRPGPEVSLILTSG